MGDGTQVVLSLAGAVDVERECARLKTDLASLEKQLESLRARLGQRELPLAREAGRRGVRATEGT
jgi:hypothetical protein